MKATGKRVREFSFPAISHDNLFTFIMLLVFKCILLSAGEKRHCLLNVTLVHDSSFITEAKRQG